MSAIRLLQLGKVVGGFLIMVLILSLSGCGGKEPAVVVDPAIEFIEDPTVWYVATTGTDTAVSCHSPATACRTIQFVVDQAANGDTIHIADGVYTGRVVITDLDLTVTGAGAGTIVENPVADENISGGGGVISLAYNQKTRSVTISDLTVRKGNALNGGGIYVRYAGLTLANVAITDSTAGVGGCLFIDAETTVVLDQVVLDGCSSNGSGGGIHNSGTLQMSNSIIRNSSANLNGGGIFNDLIATAVVSGTLLEKNIAGQDSGGGIYNAGTLEVNTSTFKENQAWSGGGVYNDDDGEAGQGHAVIVTSTFQGNISVSAVYSQGFMYLMNVTISGSIPLIYDSGFGLVNNLGTLTASYLTIADNQTAGFNLHNGGTAYFANTLFANNGKRNCTEEQLASGSHNLSSDGTCSFVSADLAGIAPLLGPLADNGGPTWTHALLPNSPAIDAGANLSYNLSVTDQRGAPRPVDGDGDGYHRNDIGAYEYSPQLATFQPDLLLTPLPPPALFTLQESGNCREGPDPRYRALTIFPPGVTVPVDGRNEAGDWYRLQAAEDLQCWVRASLGVLHGDPLGQLVREAPPLPPDPDPPPATIVCSDYTSQGTCEFHPECFWYTNPASALKTCVSK